ncbi:hypothetical protein EGR_11018 [Echinococcus granulosus]|uniref:Uncharacterized protein n=1 Tax=Echinococcus granulosus TaxID=6210 RepID=W6UKV3_ECHGR|nr:hypothetical protein EGR_11018 [Echinococcus granulosus]EUB54124.1 hypothetical protein EGR_11018 [Echinococcus granulosus]
MGWTSITSKDKIYSTQRKPNHCTTPTTLSGQNISAYRVENDKRRTSHTCCSTQRPPAFKYQHRRRKNQLSDAAEAETTPDAELGKYYTTLIQFAVN